MKMTNERFEDDLGGHLRITKTWRQVWGGPRVAEPRFAEPLRAIDSTPWSFSQTPRTRIAKWAKAGFRSAGSLPNRPDK